MRHRVRLTLAMAATALVVGHVGCTSSSWCADCAQASQILGLNYQPDNLYTEGTSIPANPPRPAGGTPITYRIVEGSLPAGLSLSATTGVISGNPTTPGVFTVRVLASNSSSSASQDLRMTVVSSRPMTVAYGTPRYFPEGVGIPPQAPVVTEATPGITTTYVISSGSLPAGLILQSDGRVAGTPTAPGVYPFTITATNGTRAASASPTYVVEVAAPLGLSYPTPRTFAPGVAIPTQAPTVANLTPQVAASFFVSGSLPAGLALNGDGTITGTPTVAGTYTFTVSLVNGTRSVTSTVDYTVEDPAPTALNYATPTTYTSGVAIGANTPNPSGGAPTSYAITSGSLPSGLSLDSSTGLITGTPSTQGGFTVTIQGSNAAGSASQTLSMTVLQAITANLTASPANLVVGQSSSLTALYGGGNGTVDQGVGSLASGGGFAVGPFGSAGSYPYTLTVTNSAGASATSTATINVSVAPPNSVTFPVPTGGTTYEDTTGGSPLQGLKVVVPSQGAVCAASSLTVVRELGQPMPGALASGVTAVSDPWTFSSTQGYPFKAPMTVTLPYDGSTLGAGDVPVPFFWDAAYGRWVSVGFKSVDTTNHRVTFTTLLQGQYAVLAVPGLSASLASQNLGFVAGTDGWFQSNQGVFDAPGGSSLGMGAFAAWYQGLRKTTNGNVGLADLLKEGDLSSPADDLSARALISRLGNGSQESWSALWSQNAYGLTDVQTGLALITGLKVTGQPQLFLMGEARPAVSNALATVVTGYDQAAQKFNVLDPNYPGMALTITWNSGTGAFSSYDRAAGYVPTFTRYAFEGQTSVHRLADYERVLNGATGGWATPPFATLAVSDVSGNGSVASGATVQVASASSVTVQGTISNGNESATHILWSQNGGARTAVPISGGAFSFTIPALTDPFGTRVILETTANPCDPTFSYTGYTEFTVKEAARAPWFPNICFEAGNTTPWILEQGSNSSKGYPSSPTFSTSTGELNGYGVTWSTGSIDSALVSAGNDARVASIPMVFDGASAFRCNDSATGAHISRIRQTITIPTDVATPKLTFYWAAVMEDPGHAASNQPYVDVIVLDEDANFEVLYFKHFFAGDPAYPGWVTSGSWKGINWQQVALTDLSARKGHRLRVMVVGADCTQTGHAGYAYLDGVNCN